MKKLYITLLLLITALTINAEVITFNAYKFAFARVNNGYYTWSDWNRSNDITVYYDTKEKQFVIDSSKMQIYNILKSYNKFVDNEGYTIFKFKVIDQDLDVGYIRFRVKNNDIQIYIDFNNVAWVYCLTK